MSSESPTRPPVSPTGQRRASFAPGTKLSEMFGGPSYSGSIAAAAANVSAHQRRRMSISTLGLSGSPNQTSPFNPTRPRQESYSSASTSPGAEPESAIDDSGDGVPPSPSPFVRRMSFGARAMRDARAAGTGAGSFNGIASNAPASSHMRNGSVQGKVGAQQHPSSPPRASIAEEAPSFPKNSVNSSNSARRTGEGFNWSDQIRSRAERTNSVTSPSTAGPGPNPFAGTHTRANTVAAVDQPAKEIPKVSKAPDHFQERILKGDFYMD